MFTLYRIAFRSCRHETLSGIVWTPIRYVTLHFTDQGGAALLRYRNHAKLFVPMCERKPFSAMVLLPAQKLSSVVWGIIGNNTLINIDAKTVGAKCSVSTKWEFYVGCFHSNFHHLNWFADTVRPFLGRDRAFSWRYSKSYTYDQLMAGTSVQDYKGDKFTWHGTRFHFSPRSFPFSGWGVVGAWGGERRRLRLQKGYLFTSVFKL